MLSDYSSIQDPPGGRKQSGEAPIAIAGERAFNGGLTRDVTRTVISLLDCSRGRSWSSCCFNTV